jgi:hypothetical protein
MISHISPDIVGESKIEAEFFRVAKTALGDTPVKLRFPRHGGLKITCPTPAIAEALVQRKGFPPDAFNGKCHVYHPGENDPIQPKRIAPHTDQEARTVLTSGFPFDASEDYILRVLKDTVEKVTFIPARDLNRAPLTVLVMKTRELAAEACNPPGLRWFGRRILCRGNRPTVLPLYCARCCAFGHVAARCPNQEEICSRCAKQHLTSKCTLVDGAPMTCPNCGENHPASWRGCVEFKKACDDEKAARLNYQQNRRDNAVMRTLLKVPRNGGTSLGGGGKTFNGGLGRLQPGTSYAATAGHRMPAARLHQPPPARNDWVEATQAMMTGMTTALERMLTAQTEFLARILDRRENTAAAAVRTARTGAPPSSTL